MRRNLANENFIARAKPEVVAQTKEKLAELTEQLEAIEKHLAELGRVEKRGTENGYRS